MGAYPRVSVEYWRVSLCFGVSGFHRKKPKPPETLMRREQAAPPPNHRKTLP